MTDAERRALAYILRLRRQQLGWSSAELARRAGVDKGLLTKLDQRQIANPRIETIRALARALDIPLADLYAVTNWLPEEKLPSIRPYMRAKYDHLPDEAVAEVEAMVERLSRRYGHGPQAGEDE